MYFYICSRKQEQIKGWGTRLERPIHFANTKINQIWHPIPFLLLMFLNPDEMTNVEMEQLSSMVATKVYRMLKRDLAKGAIQAMAKEPTERQAEDWLTTEEAAEYMKCSASHLRRIAIDVPHEKLGGRYRFSRQSLSDYIARRKA